MSFDYGAEKWECNGEWEVGVHVQSRVWSIWTLREAVIESVRLDFYEFVGRFEVGTVPDKLCV